MNIYDHTKIATEKSVHKPNFYTNIKNLPDLLTLSICIDSKWKKNASLALKLDVRGSSVAHTRLFSLYAVCVCLCDDASRLPKIKLTIAKDHNVVGFEKFSQTNRAYKAIQVWRNLMKIYSRNHLRFQMKVFLQKYIQNRSNKRFSTSN